MWRSGQLVGCRDEPCDKDYPLSYPALPSLIDDECNQDLSLVDHMFPSEVP